MTRTQKILRALRALGALLIWTLTALFAFLWVLAPPALFGAFLLAAASWLIGEPMHLPSVLAAIFMCAAQQKWFDSMRKRTRRAAVRGQQG